MEAEMGNKIKNRKFLARGRVLAAVFAILLLSLGGYRMKVRAAEDVFGIEAGLIAGGDGSTYDIRLTIQNNGQDWEGTVRLLIEDGGYRTPSAYDTDMALPGGGRKQFTVKIPVDCIQEAKRSYVYVVLLDGAGREAAYREFPRFLNDEADALLMGILSDDYSSLTYLDMGGQELYYHDDEYPVRLVELNQDNLAEYLDSLTILVIDRYSTEVLTDEDMEAIQYWNLDGGMLIVGTGAYAEDTLSGFDNNYLGVSSAAVYPPGADRPSGGYTQLSAPLDMEKLTLAQLQTRQPDYDTDYYSYSGILACSWGNGAIAVLPYALTELGKLDAAAFGGMNRTDYIFELLNEIGNYSRMRYITNAGYYDLAYNRSRLFGIISNSSDAINLGVLKVIVVLYVIFVGPVLYLILKLLRKRELYWMTVPATALLGIGIIYLAGRGFEVKDTRVYSVTVTDLAGQEKKKTYLQCFDAGHSEWQLKLSGDYEYIGALNSTYNSYDSLKYYHHFKKNGDEIYFGIKPSASFESGFFYAGGADLNGNKGSVELSGVNAGLYGLSGTVVNRTDSDFSSFAVIVDGSMYLYDALPAGESRELADMGLFYAGPAVYGTSSYIHQLRTLYTNGEQVDARAALGIGICAVAAQAEAADVFFMGVTENYEKAVDDTCSETSYGCFYAVQ